MERGESRIVGPGLTPDEKPASTPVHRRGPVPCRRTWRSTDRTTCRWVDFRGTLPCLSSFVAGPAG